MWVPCRYFRNVPVNFQILKCRQSIFKKCPLYKRLRRPVKVEGQRSQKHTVPTLVNPESAKICGKKLSDSPFQNPGSASHICIPLYAAKHAT